MGTVTKSGQSANDNIADIALLGQTSAMTFVVALSIISLVAGETVLAESKDWSAEVEAIAEKCWLPPKKLLFVDGSVLWIEPEKTGYEQAMCVIDELKARGVPMKHGYVRNGS